MRYLALFLIIFTNKMNSQNMNIKAESSPFNLEVIGYTNPLKNSIDGKLYFEVVLKLTNRLSKENLSYYTMSCSWQDNFTCEPSIVNVKGPVCEENGTTTETILANESKEYTLVLYFDEKQKSNLFKIKMKLDYFTADIKTKEMSTRTLLTLYTKDIKLK